MFCWLWNLSNSIFVAFNWFSCLFAKFVVPLCIRNLWGTYCIQVHVHLIARDMVFNVYCTNTGTEVSNGPVAAKRIVGSPTSPSIRKKYHKNSHISKGMNTLREKCPNTHFFLVCIFPHSLSVFSLNAGKYGPEKTLYLDTFHVVIITDFGRFSHFRLSCFNWMNILNNPQVKKGFKSFAY